MNKICYKKRCWEGHDRDREYKCEIVSVYLPLYLVKRKKKNENIIFSTKSIRQFAFQHENWDENGFVFSHFFFFFESKKRAQNILHFSLQIAPQKEWFVKRMKVALRKKRKINEKSLNGGNINLRKKSQRQILLLCKVKTKKKKNYLFLLNGICDATEKRRKKNVHKRKAAKNIFHISC